MTTEVFGVHYLRALYVGVFGLAAVVCFASLSRSEAIDDDDIRRGLSGLLLAGGAWASAHVGRLLVPAPELKVAFHLVGLFVGFSSVFAWLYFCSAYTGRSYHRDPRVRRLAVLLLGGVIAVKLTNPVHGLYFTTSVASTPFPHLVIQQGTLHWVVTGLAYALSTVGFYMLFELFSDIEYDTTVLGFLFLLTGAPVILDIVGYVRADLVVELNYEPLGVALFAVGVLYVTETTFLAVPRVGRQQLVDALDQAVLFLDADHRLLDANAAACEALPAIEAGFEQPLSTSVPALADPVAADGDVVSIDAAGTGALTHYLVNVTPLTAGETGLGRAVTLTDVTAVERQRQTLRRQNEQLDGFAAAIAHELRNATMIIEGNADLVTEEVRADSSPESPERLAEISETAERMNRIVGDLTTLARLSRAVEDPPMVAFTEAVRTAWAQLEEAAEGLQVALEGEGRLAVDEPRLVELLRNVARIARRTDAATVQVALTGTRLTITTDGEELRVADPAAVFEYGTAVPDSRLGMLFANVQALARAHGWQVSLDHEYTGGIRMELTDITVEASGARN